MIVTCAKNRRHCQGLETNALRKSPFSATEVRTPFLAIYTSFVDPHCPLPIANRPLMRRRRRPKKDLPASQWAIGNGRLAMIVTCAKNRRHCQGLEANALRKSPFSATEVWTPFLAIYTSLADPHCPLPIANRPLMRRRRRPKKDPSASQWAIGDGRLAMIALCAKNRRHCCGLEANALRKSPFSATEARTLFLAIYTSLADPHCTLPIANRPLMRRRMGLE